MIIINHPPIRDRYEGYKAALKDHEIEINDKYIFKTTEIKPYEFGYQIGQRIAIEKIIDLIYNSGPSNAKLEHIVLPVELIIRKSCGSPG